MIVSLILGTLAACQSQQSKPPPVTPTSPQTKTSTEKSLQITTPAPKNTIKDIQIVAQPPKPRENLEDYRYSLAVHPSDIYTAHKDRFCLDACFRASTDRLLEVMEENCTIELIQDWKKQIEIFEKKQTESSKSIVRGSKDNPIIGRVECSGIEDLPIEGRRMIRQSARSTCSQDLAGYFARAAQDEAIAVYAFEEILQTLQDWNAPKELQTACTKAIEEEKKHTLMMSSLAKKHGCTHISVSIQKSSKVSKLEFATQNAVAGCIEETWAAFLAYYRAQHTQQYQALFARIADDECGHAQLSWDIHKWMMEQLTDQEKNIVLEQIQERLNTPISNRQGLVPLSTQQHEQAWNHFSHEIRQLLAA